MHFLRNFSRPLTIVALAVTPILAVSCGDDSSSSRLSDEEFCAKLVEIEASNAFNLDENDPEMLQEMLTVFADLAQTAPTDELKKAFETMGPLIEKMSEIDENDPDALGEVMSMMFDPEVAAAGETLDAYSTDVCKIPPTTDSSSMDDSSMTFPPSTDDQTMFDEGTILGDMAADEITNAVDALKSTNFPNGYISSSGIEATSDGSSLVTVDFADIDSVDAVAICEAIDAAITEKTNDANVSIKISVDGKEVGGRPVGGTCSAK
jgi:hypothetical protein